LSNGSRTAPATRCLHLPIRNRGLIIFPHNGRVRDTRSNYAAVTSGISQNGSAEENAVSLAAEQLIQCCRWLRWTLLGPYAWYRSGPV
jgi:hypothetical protein